MYIVCTNVRHWLRGWKPLHVANGDYTQFWTFFTDVKPSIWALAETLPIAPSRVKTSLYDFSFSNFFLQSFRSEGFLIARISHKTIVCKL